MAALRHRPRSISLRPGPAARPGRTGGGSGRDAQRLGNPRV